MRYALAVLVGVLALRLVDPWPVETLRLKYFDTLLTLDDPVVSETVALYDIDEAQLAIRGQWPWPREDLAWLSYQLRAQGAAAVVYTVLFPEVDRFGGDEAFAESMNFIPTVLAATTTVQTDRQEGWHIGVATMGPVMDHALAYPGIVPNVPILQEHAAGTGVVSTTAEVDGLVRRVPMLVRVGEALYPALGLDVLRVLVGDPSYQAKASGEGLVAVRVPGFDSVETDSQGRVWIKWNSSFERKVKDRVVFVGVTAEGVSPMIPTPRGLMHAHEIQASLLASLIEGDTPKRPDWALGAEWMLLLLLGVAVVLCTRFLSAPWVPAFILVSGALVASGSVWGYVRLGLLLDAALPVVSTLLVGGVGLAHRMLTEYRLKLQIRGQFGTYVSPDLVKQLENDPSLLVLGGETKTMTFLFADIVGFTPISEKLQEDPQALVALINRLLTQLTDCVLHHGGTVDKFMGDCIMAFWGAPLDCEDHAERAMLTARDMLALLDELNRQLDEEGLPHLNIGVGINSGPCVVGNMGSERRFDYSILGDSVNQASRYEGQTRNYDEWILIGESTVQYKPEWTRFVDTIQVKGKSEPLRVYTLDGI